MIYIYIYISYNITYIYIHILYYIILHTYIRIHRRIPQTSHISLFMLPQLSVAQGRKKHWLELAMRKALAIAPRGQRAMELLNISVPVAEEHVFFGSSEGCCQNKPRYKCSNMGMNHDSG